MVRSKILKVIGKNKRCDPGERVECGAYVAGKRFRRITENRTIQLDFMFHYIKDLWS